MAQTEHLPIYKSAYDLCLYFEQVARNFSRYHTNSIIPHQPDWLAAPYQGTIGDLPVPFYRKKDIQRLSD